MRNVGFSILVRQSAEAILYLYCSSVTDLCRVLFLLLRTSTRKNIDMKICRYYCKMINSHFEFERYELKSQSSAFDKFS